MSNTNTHTHFLSFSLSVKCIYCSFSSVKYLCHLIYLTWRMYVSYQHTHTLSLHTHTHTHTESVAFVSPPVHIIVSSTMLTSSIHSAMSIFQLSTKLLDKSSPVWSWLENVLRFTTKGWVHWKLVTITIAIILMFYRSTSRRTTSPNLCSVEVWSVWRWMISQCTWPGLSNCLTKCIQQMLKHSYSKLCTFYTHHQTESWCIFCMEYWLLYT